ncbi:MAG: acyl-CoA thioesterase, partial [Anaerolineae bacterium]|nr:acyl-CoA thioesterase [Anaerolineae bacterium]
MPDFHFSIPIDIRYGDLDPQWHVNNARTVSLIE